MRLGILACIPVNFMFIQESTDITIFNSTNKLIVKLAVMNNI